MNTNKALWIALGVILLELGLWSRADQLDDAALLKLADAFNSDGVRKKLLAHATVRLAFFAGELYRDVVIACLKGTWQEQSIVDGFSNIVVTLEAISKGLHPE